MSEIKVLINNAGSQAADIIRLLNGKGVSTICLSAKTNTEAEKNAEEFLYEPQIEDIVEYADYLVHLCSQYSVNVFIPFRRMDELVSCRMMFEKNGIKFMAPKDTDLFVKLNNKIKTYELIKKFAPEIIPEYAQLSALMSAYKAEPCRGVYKLFEKVKQGANPPEFLCIKAAKDIAASSFRKIAVNDDIGDKILTPNYKNVITREMLYDIVDHLDMDNDLIIMEYLCGKEVSCDCLKTPNGNIVIPRIKQGSKTQLVWRQEKIVHYCNMILDELNYDTPCNIQFKWEEGHTPKLLEINTRMSGGIFLSSHTSCINIPVRAVRQILGLPQDPPDMDWLPVMAETKTAYTQSEFEIGGQK